MSPIHGTTDPRFQAVRAAFAANFRDHGEVGAALCVYFRGRRVGRHRRLTTGTPWAEDTLQYVFSTTKGFTATCAHLLVQPGELDLDAPIAGYWPEFAATGKRHIPVRWLPPPPSPTPSTRPSASTPASASAMPSPPPHFDGVEAPDDGARPAT